MAKTIPDQSHNSTGFNPSDLSIVLDFIPEAAILILNNRILAVNSKATELTAYTRKELNSKPLKQIIKNAGEFFSPYKPTEFKKKSSRLFVSTRYGTSIQVKTEIRPLQHNIFLLIMTPPNMDSKYSGAQVDYSPTFSNILEIIRAIQIQDPQGALVKSLEAGVDLLGTSILALYIGNSQKPSVRRVAYSGKIDIFPSEIYPIEINHFIQPSIWTQDHKSITTILHQEASAAGLAYLATCPVGDIESNAMIGILVAGGYQNNIPKYYLMNLQILSDSISNIISKNVLISNLQNTIQDDKQSISFLSTVKNIVSDGIITIGPNLKVTEINSSAEIALGYKDIDLHGAEISEVLIGNEKIVQAIEQALQGTTTPEFRNINLHRRDGTEFPALLSIHPKQSDNKILGAYIILRDKSDQEYLQGKIRQLENQALLGEVTSIFAHEVRNPINNISTGLQLLAEEVKGDDTSEEIIQRIHQDCIRLDKLMESVLTISRTRNFKFVPLNIGEMLDSLIHSWKSRIMKFNIETIATIPPEEILVNADKQALEQVFTNLINNAVQAMENMKGGTLAIKLSHIITTNERKTVQIDISDTGSGISSENRTRIFEPFFSTKENGTGLGLPITKQIVTAHKGSINLTSFPGGTVFHVKLPVHTILENNT